MERNYSPEDIRRLLAIQQQKVDADSTAANAQATMANRRPGVEYDYGAGANALAQALVGAAGPEAAIARMLYDTTKRDPNPAIRAGGASTLQMNLRKLLGAKGGLGNDMQTQAAAPQLAPAQPARQPGPGPFGSSQAVPDAAEELKRMQMERIMQAMQQAELTRTQDNRGFAQNRESRASGAYELLMKLLPKFMGRI